MERIIKKRDGITYQIVNVKQSLLPFVGEEVIDPRKLSYKALTTKEEALKVYRQRYEGVYEELCMEANETEIVEIRRDYDNTCNICAEVENLLEIVKDKMSISEEISEPVENEGGVSQLIEQLIGLQRESIEQFSNLQMSSQRSIEKTQRDILEQHRSVESRNVALPRLELKVFAGGYTQWVEFYDGFKSAVHFRKDLTPTQKLQYLKSSLNGEPSNLIKTLSLQDDNYDIALNILKNRYDDPETIKNAHFENIFNLKGMTQRSVSNLRRICSVLEENVQALHNLGEPVEYWDSWLIYTTKKKLDPETRIDWERHVATQPQQKFTDIMKYLAQLARALESVGDCKVNKLKIESPVQKFKSEPSGYPIRSFHQIEASSVERCFVCDQNHSVTQCQKFLKMYPRERKENVCRARRCLNCFSRKHFATRCPKTAGCRSCSLKHHSLLHWETRAVRSVDGNTRSASNSSNEMTSVSSHIARPMVSKEVLLSTALVGLRSANGQIVTCRALIDPGSQASFVTENTVKQLRLRITSENEGVQVKGIGGIANRSITSRARCELFTFHGNMPCMSMDALVIDRVTERLPRNRVDVCDWPELRHLRLADEGFFEPGPIDMLIGADVYAKVLSRTGNVLRNECGSLVAQETIFGWVISGITNSNGTAGASLNGNVVVHFVESQRGEDQLLKRFWEIEDVAVSRSNATSLEEKACEKHFEDTYSRRDDDGRYVVSLPRKPEHSLGNSRMNAVRRLQQIERRLERDPQMRESYKNTIEDYFELGHAEPVPKASIEKMENDTFYMPHHCVIKSSSTTTKLRVVFDASAKTANGLSLNDTLMDGPKLQDDLFDILVRFRLHPIAFSADVTKMYRQIVLAEEDRDLHRFVWRKNSTDEVRDFRMKAVAFGVRSSAYHAQRVLMQLAMDDGERFPLAKTILEKDFYMDDCLSGASNVETAVRTRRELSSLLGAGGFHLRKWSSNCAEFLADIDVVDREAQIPLNMDLDSAAVKTLGVYWVPSTDVFSFKIQECSGKTSSPELQQLNVDIASVTTKREVLSYTARIFDPLGFLAPTLIVAKILLQRTWQFGVDWDDALPNAISGAWQNWRKELDKLDGLRYDRCLVSKEDSVEDYHLHGFADASQSAYACVIYLRTVDVWGKVTVTLIASKTKVAPIKTLSLPRLELCANLLLARLLHRVKESLRLPSVTVYAWSDSTVALDWICGSANRWKTFVANRVSEIQDLINPSCWRHCPTECNPSDCASRGISPEQLMSHNLWWSGPSWLTQDFEHWPSRHRDYLKVETEKEMRKNVTVCHAVEVDGEVLRNTFSYSSWTKLTRVTAWCRRWLQLRKSHGEKRVVGPLTCDEINKAANVWIRVAQVDGFSQELSCLKRDDELPNKSRIVGLSPFLDSEGIIRVGGRLSAAKLPYAAKHPVLLPKEHFVVTLIVEKEHKNSLHAGPQLMMSLLRDRYWIVNARNKARSVVNKCIVCRRYRAKTIEQLMGPLPSSRVEPARAFSKTGVDYAGPFLLKTKTGRGARTEKCWLSLFVCFTTKAVHIELVTRLTTQAFLAAFRRFISRRGHPTVMYSDNGTNFVGANRELKELKLLLLTQNHNNNIAEELSQAGIEWVFSPERASHFGGLWEAGVKSVKYHLKRTLGNAILTFEEMSTVLCQIEACLNSRPLVPMSSDPSDLNVLTPGHFLVHAPLNALPEPSLTDIKINRLDRWQYVQLLQQHFWKRWSKDYLSRMQQRPKWFQRRRDLKIGDLVLMAEDNLPPSKWARGRVEQTHPGRDGHVRVVTLRTATSTFRRPVVKLTLLFSPEE